MIVIAMLVWGEAASLTEDSNGRVNLLASESMSKRDWKASKISFKRELRDRGKQLSRS